MNIMDQLERELDAPTEKEVAKKLHCESQSCILKKAEEQNILSKEVVERVLETNFKAEGPRNTTRLMSNFNSDDVLERWEREFSEFYPHKVNTIDFAVYGGSLQELNTANLLREGKTKTACVVNTDVHTGRGIHWFAVFTDCSSGDKWTIEHFNSSGNPPRPQIVEWAAKTNKELKKYQEGAGLDIPIEFINANKFRHQKSQTECGPYSLYYIRARLDGIPPDYFSKNLVTDSAMIEFRKHVFREY
jgi:hypothetical protein